MTNTRRILCAFLLLATSVTSTTMVMAQDEDDEEPLTLTGCLLLSRRVGVYALHMEYNRIAAAGHADLASHVGHIVTLTGQFEEQDERLMFVVEDVAHVAATCEAQASMPPPGSSPVG